MQIKIPTINRLTCALDFNQVLFFSFYAKYIYQLLSTATDIKRFLPNYIRAFSLT